MTLSHPLRIVVAIALGVVLASLPFVQYRYPHTHAHAHERNAP